MARFRRSQRLLDPAAFAFVFADPISAGDTLVTVLARANGRGHARLGLAVARRRIRHAVSRNRFKRLVRESFRAHQHELAGLDIVVLAKAGAAKAEPSALRASIDQQWGRLRTRMSQRAGAADTNG